MADVETNRKDLEELVGAKIVEAIVDQGGAETHYGLRFELGSWKGIVWFVRDDESMHPGFFHVQTF